MKKLFGYGLVLGLIIGAISLVVAFPLFFIACALIFIALNQIKV